MMANLGLSGNGIGAEGKGGNGEGNGSGGFGGKRAIEEVQQMEERLLDREWGGMGWAGDVVEEGGKMGF